VLAVSKPTIERTSFGRKTALLTHELNPDDLAGQAGGGGNAENG